MANMHSLYCLCFILPMFLDIIYNCPSNCECKSNFVNCTSKYKDKIPVGNELDSTVEHLILSWNNITTLPDQVFWDTRATGLKVIYLKKNCIKYISETAFWGQKYLEYVDLSFNNISNISLSLFKWTNNLKWLSLAHNPLVSFDAAVINLESIDLSFCLLTEIPNIKAVDVNLENNNITRVGKVKLEYIDKIEKLKLSRNPFICDCDLQDFMDYLETYEICPSKECSNPGNVTYNMRSKNCTVCPIGCECFYWGIANCSNAKLTEIPGEGFNSRVTTILLSMNRISLIKNYTFLQMNATNLQYLSLNHNKISVIESVAFSGLSKLQYLDLSFNNLNQLYNISFIEMPALTQLSLASNTFTSVSIANRTNVKHLDLSCCRIKNFSEVAKYWGHSLTWLSLKRNEISFFSEKDLNNMTSMSSIDISENPLECYDNLTGAYLWLKRRGLAKNSTCSFPPSVSGQYWQVLDINQTVTTQPLTTPLSSSTSEIVLIITTVLAMLFSVLLCIYIHILRKQYRTQYYQLEQLRAQQLSDQYHRNPVDQLEENHDDEISLRSM